ncbi:mitogen-activated protein kinase kinase kinase YODA [Canna indica]|uniref:mitogen-activated protein kinase kinase kinase n=1 Tax=Canna indica TaxID=4628 RepID=A0AAQ3KG93_9LILI|nr:mitogen-activated protein kinase kinase kinase YODA [Canna indica]
MSSSVFVMPWWKSSSCTRNHLFPSSSSSSSSSSPKISRGASRSGRAKDLRFFPWSRREAPRRLTRQRKLRHLTDLDIEALSLEDPADSYVFTSSTPVSRTSSNLDAVPTRSESSPMLLPRPLPLPEDAAALTCRDSESSRTLGFSPLNSVGCPLPSPSQASGRAEGNDGNESVAELGSRLAYQTNCRSPQQVAIPSNKTTISHRRKVFLDPNSSQTETFRLNIPSKSVPVSEFSSPVDSPVHSPRRLSSVEFSTSAIVTPGLQVWSLPEVPSMGIMEVYLSQTSPDRTKHSPELSSHSSPSTKTPILRSRNSSAPPSPLHTKMFQESSATRHENGGNVNVHPLPLPPGASPPSQSNVFHQSATKAEGSLMPNQWQKGKLIGSGTFGTVYEATNRNTGALCAMKEVNIIPDDPKSAECLKQLEQEIKFLSQLKHPNIVQYYGSETIEDQLYIYLEYVHPGSINKYVRQYCGAMTESVVRNFTRHILNGLIYLHSKKVMHRDIKGANLLVDSNGVVKLADFGMAKHLSGAAPSHSLKGSPFWMAPEMLQATMNKEIGYDLAVDIWSLGCTIIEMFTGKHPWNDLEGPQAMFKVLHKDPPIPQTLSNEGKDFLHCCFHRNPAERPTASMLLDHPFVRNANHYNLHNSLQAFAESKPDNTISPRDKGLSKSEQSLKRKPISNGENNHSPEISESAAPHLSSRSIVEGFPSSSSPARLSPAGSIANSQNGVQLGAGNSQRHLFPNPAARKPNPL